MRKTIALSILLAFVSCSFTTKPQSEYSTPKSENEMTYSILVLYRATNHWLMLSREERGQFFETKIAPIMQKYEGKLSVRLFDSEAFHAKTSDFMLIECQDLQDYYYFMEYLRDTELFSKPYIELNDVIIGVENGFQSFEKEEFNKD